MATGNNDELQWTIGDFVPYSFQPGIVVASYLVSLVGALSTVEILHMRKAGTGWLSWVQLAFCSVLFGLVAIWGMHFVGNAGIIMGHGEKELQLYYNPGFTALSAFLPIVFLFCGFSVVERHGVGRKSLYGSLVICGVIAGLAIGGMHYMGNFSTANYHLYFTKGSVGAACAIAVAACWISFTLFFHQKEHWINSWWRRLICACLLAGAVSGMHWVATVGTTYKLKSLHPGGGVSRHVNLIIAIVMCFLAVIVCFVLGILLQRRRRWLADRAQHVVLASATFDVDGRLLVTQEGLLPSQKITRQFNQRSFTDEFNVAHPVFQWIYRVTWNWSCVTDLIPAMRSHLKAMGSLKDPLHPVNSDPLSQWNATNEEQDYSVIFREHFCVAAADLAGALNAPIQELGVLYDQILMTGSSTVDPRSRRVDKKINNVAPHELEAGLVIPALFGKGQLLFVTRRIDKAEATRLVSSGYRFAYFDQVGDILSRTMQVPRTDLNNTVSRLRQYAHTDNIVPTSGTYLACFALRPGLKTATGNWHVLVEKSRPCQLPQIELCPGQLNGSQLSTLARMDGLSLNQCLQYLQQREDSTLKDDKDFLDMLTGSITALTHIVPEPFFRNAHFSAQPVHSAAKRVSEPDSDRALPEAQATIFAFCIVADVHSQSVKTTDRLNYVPFSFFNCGQRIYEGSPDHAILTRRIHREFSSILAHQQKLEQTYTPVSSRKGSLARAPSISTPRLKFFSRGNSKRASQVIVHPDSSSERELVKVPSREVITHTPFGGIMVHQDVQVHEDKREGSQLELSDLGLRSTITAAGMEESTYVDELFRVTCARWQKS